MGQQEGWEVELLLPPLFPDAASWGLAACTVWPRDAVLGLLSFCPGRMTGGPSLCPLSPPRLCAAAQGSVHIPALGHSFPHRGDWWTAVPATGGTSGLCPSRPHLKDLQCVATGDAALGSGQPAVPSVLLTLSRTCPAPVALTTAGPSPDHPSAWAGSHTAGVVR